MGGGPRPPICEPDIAGIYFGVCVFSQFFNRYVGVVCRVALSLYSQGQVLGGIILLVYVEVLE